MVDLSGAIDLHLHSSPDVVPRKMSDIALARAAHAAKLAAILLKCHNSPTTARAALTAECVSGIKVFGGIVLNQAAGGLNPAAVEAELAIGAKEVWLPTISALNHLRNRGGDLLSAVPVVNDAGRLVPEIYNIFELLKASEAILGTGHISPMECEKVIEAAQEIGVRKILVTHPELEITAMPVSTQKRLARRGVFFERCFYATNSEQRLEPSIIARQIMEVGTESTVLSSDFGQVNNVEPPEGLRRFVEVLQGCGISDKEIDTMIRVNPRYLLGL